MALAAVATEEIRNRLLRRADWRFLLPDPAPRRTVCFAGGLLADAVRLVSTTVVDPPVADGDCDLAVAVDPDAGTLARAWRALRPGGWCYTEWTAREGRRPRAIRRRLRAAAFTPTACYWPRPDSADGTWTVWYPVGATGALVDVLRYRPPVASRGRPWQFAWRWLRWRLAPTVGLASPLLALAQKPSPGSAAPNVALELTRAHWSRWGLGAPPARLSTLLVTRGSRSVGKVVAVLFAEPDPAPRVAIKMSRTREASVGLAREAANLRALHRRLGDVPGVPRLLFVRRRGGLLAVGETALAGTPMVTLLTAGNYRSLALRATAWLTRLAGRGPARPPDEWRSRLIAPVLRDFESHFGAVADPVRLKETYDALDACGASPLVCEQRDFSPWNVHVTPKDELAVFDWESAELDGLPLLDLLYFLAYLAFQLDHARPDHADSVAASYRKMLRGASFTGAVARECIAEYRRAVSLDEALVRPLRLLLWLLHSRSEYRHMVADVGGRPGPEILRRSVFLALWEQELDRS